MQLSIVLLVHKKEQHLHNVRAVPFLFGCFYHFVSSLNAGLYFKSAHVDEVYALVLGKVKYTNYRWNTIYSALRH